MKNLKNLIAIVTLVSILGVGSSFASDLTADGNNSNQQYSQIAESWLESLFNQVKGYLTGNDSDVADDQAVHERIAYNHNETLVRDEN